MSRKSSFDDKLKVTFEINMQIINTNTVQQIV